MKNMAKWLTHEFSSGCYAGDDYIQFQKEMKADLNKQLKACGLNLHAFNKNHYCFSAVVTNGEKFAYISVPDVRGNNEWAYRVLYRTMKHDKDWTGGQNNYCSWEHIAENCKRLIERGR